MGHLVCIEKWNGPPWVPLSVESSVNILSKKSTGSTSSIEFYEVPMTAHAWRCLIFNQQPFVMPLQPEKHGPSAVRAAFLCSTASPICWPCFLVWYFPGTDRIFTSSSAWAVTRDGTTVLKAAYTSPPQPSPPQKHNNVEWFKSQRSLLKEVFHQTHTKEQSLVPNLSIVSVLRWFLGE